MQRVCANAWCQAAFEIDDIDHSFLENVSPVIGDRTFPLPLPTRCPGCRQQRRLAFRNERKLYRRSCDLCKQSIISIYTPESPLTVYCPTCWWGDRWDAMSYGRPYDVHRSFLEQFGELWRRVPRIALIIVGDNVNSEFTHDNYRLKNCYYVFDGEQGVDCYYGETFAVTKDCCDFLFLQQSELCYECVNCFGCYNLRFAHFCQNCSDSQFLTDCLGCRNCLGCINLREKQYHILNQPYQREDYERKIAALRIDTTSGIRAFQERAETLFRARPRKAMRTMMCESVTGDNLISCKDCFECYDCVNCRDCRFCTSLLMGASDCLDVNIWGDNMRLVYDSAVCGNGAETIIGSYYAVIGASNIFHSAFCGWSSSHLFGCVGLRHKQYCILNKQYSTEEWEEMLPRIIEGMQARGEWGEFFPVALSDFGYNETVGQDYFPITREEATARGWLWRDKTEEVPQVERIVAATDLPESIAEVPDDVLNWAIRCEVSGRPYRIQKAELDLYRRIAVPLPRQHFDVRHAKRLALRNPRKLWTRTCAKCGTEIQTTYSPDRPEIVYCERCYLEAVYSSCA